MGREFIDLFDEWADSYDETVQGSDPAYKAVFENYDRILEEVADKAGDVVLEFGVGTANLSKKMIDRKKTVYGVEPSLEMRKIAAGKCPQMQLLDGDFLTFPDLPENVHSIVSSYAFHHLTDEEKDKAFAIYSAVLPKNGKIIFADTMFIDDNVKQTFIDNAREKGWHDLASDLEEEYYPLKKTLETLLDRHEFDLTLSQRNDYVWLIEAVKR